MARLQQVVARDSAQVLAMRDEVSRLGKSVVGLQEEVRRAREVAQAQRLSDGVRWGQGIMCLEEHPAETESRLENH
jgi:VIT1/CCC1 family predicted Fe2+/Mn2+ transporter